jgi:hypothetical protein
MIKECMAKTKKSFTYLLIKNVAEELLRKGYAKMKSCFVMNIIYSMPTLIEKGNGFCPPSKNSTTYDVEFPLIQLE